MPATVTKKSKVPVPKKSAAKPASAPKKSAVKPASIPKKSAAKPASGPKEAAVVISKKSASVPKESAVVISKKRTSAPKEASVVISKKPASTPKESAVVISKKRTSGPKESVSALKEPTVIVRHKIVVVKRSHYIEENKIDIVIDWLRKYYILGGENTISSSDLYDEYKTDNPWSTMSHSNFGLLIGQAGIQRVKRSGRSAYIGITRVCFQETPAVDVPVVEIPVVDVQAVDVPVVEIPVVDVPKVVDVLTVDAPKVVETQTVDVIKVQETPKVEEIKIPRKTQDKKNIPKILKDLTWNKWIGENIGKSKCMCCGIMEIKMNNFHCGHVVSEAKGGKMMLDNLRPICSGCNMSMGTENLYEFKEKWGFV